jgi:hypothetical protein
MACDLLKFDPWALTKRITERGGAAVSDVKGLWNGMDAVLKDFLSQHTAHTASIESAVSQTSNRLANTASEGTSMKLSIPKPTSEMLPANQPAITATKPSATFHAIVKYASFRPPHDARPLSYGALKHGHSGEEAARTVMLTRNHSPLDDCRSAHLRRYSRGA